MTEKRQLINIYDIEAIEVINHALVPLENPPGITELAEIAFERGHTAEELYQILRQIIIKRESERLNDNSESDTSMQS